MRIEVRVKGLNEALEYTREVGHRLDNRRVGGMFKVLNKVGDVWMDNFRSEGSRVGKWPQLSDFTMDVREEQGFPGAHPILERSGALKSVTVGRMQNAKVGGPYSKGDGYGGPLTTSNIKVGDSRMTINAHGWKVSNQYPIPGKNGHPARPIWFVDRTVLYAAQSGLVDWLVNDVLDTR
jgi:hypothetical protein